MFNLKLPLSKMNRKNSKKRVREPSKITHSNKRKKTSHTNEHLDTDEDFDDFWDMLSEKKPNKQTHTHTRKRNKSSGQLPNTQRHTPKKEPGIHLSGQRSVDEFHNTSRSGNKQYNYKGIHDFNNKHPRTNDIVVEFDDDDDVDGNVDDDEVVDDYDDVDDYDSDRQQQQQQDEQATNTIGNNGYENCEGENDLRPCFSPETQEVIETLPPLKKGEKCFACEFGRPISAASSDSKWNYMIQMYFHFSTFCTPTSVAIHLYNFYEQSIRGRSPKGDDDEDDDDEEDENDGQYPRWSKMMIYRHFYHHIDNEEIVNEQIRKAIVSYTRGFVRENLWVCGRDGIPRPDESPKKINSLARLLTMCAKLNGNGSKTQFSFYLPKNSAPNGIFADIKSLGAVSDDTSY
jgi:hypothetical protein